MNTAQVLGKIPVNHFCVQAEKKALNDTEARDKALLQKSSLDINLVEEDEEDKRIAHLLNKYKTVSCKCRTFLLCCSVGRGCIAVRTLGSQSREPGFESSCCCFEALSVSFIPRCHSLFRCINEYLATDRGGYFN